MFTKLLIYQLPKNIRKGVSLSKVTSYYICYNYTKIDKRSKLTIHNCLFNISAYEQAAASDIRMVYSSQYLKFISGYFSQILRCNK